MTENSLRSARARSHARDAAALVQNGSVTDALDLFNDKPVNRPTEQSAAPMMTESQRKSIKHAFAELSVTGAREQFAVVFELTGRHITSVAQLEARHAQTLIYGLEEKIRTLGRKNTGSAWDDREEDTWIDKL